jgi:hypothetical protein
MINFAQSDLFLYRKCDDLEIGQSRVDGEFIDIPNYGSCDYAFFYHIVNNYDNLADYNVFTKLNWRGDFSNAPEVFINCVNFDFYQGGSSPLSHVWYDNDSTELLNLPTKYYRLPMNVSITKDKKEFGTDEYFYAGHADQQVDWFSFLYKNTKMPGEVCTNQRGPCFSVSRELILRHPKSVYQHFLEIFYPFNSWDYEAAKKTFGTEDVKQQTWSIGRHYHDELLRFYRVLFTHGIDEDKYQIHKL